MQMGPPRARNTSLHVAPATGEIARLALRGSLGTKMGGLDFSWVDPNRASVSYLPLCILPTVLMMVILGCCVLSYQKLELPLAS